MSLAVIDSDAAYESRPASSLVAQLPPVPTSSWPAYLLANRNHISVHERMELMLNLRDIWRAQAHRLTISELGVMANMAEWLCDWILLASVAKAGLCRGSEFTDYFLRQQFLAHLHTADYQGAMDTAVCGLLARPSNSFLPAGREQLLEWLSYRRQHCLGVFESLRGEKLVLEPLGHHHAASYMWQYLDSDIPQLCCLPRFEQSGQYHQWFEQEQALPGRELYALTHWQWGFIGMVGFSRFQKSGFFYYWIGQDFRGIGYGPEAVSYLLHTKFKEGAIDCCFAKAFTDNSRSIRVLLEMGFEIMDFIDDPSYGNETFFYLGDTIPYLKKKYQLTKLLNYLSH